MIRNLRPHKMRRGSTLIEVLVTMVIFLVGLLAVIQIFPRGFQVLLQSRNDSVATTLARAELEQLKAFSDRLPESIMAVRYVGGVVIADPTHDPDDLGPLGNQLASNGFLSWSGIPVGYWPYASGANVFRRVIGEGRTIPAPRQIGSDFGSMLVPQYGPVDAKGAPITAYANDLLPVAFPLMPGVPLSDSEYVVQNPSLPSIAVGLASGPTTRLYHVTFSGFVLQGGRYQKFDYVDLPAVQVPAGLIDPRSGGYQPYYVSLASLLPNGTQLGSVDLGSLRVQRQFEQIPLNTTFAPDDPFQFKVEDADLGALLFNPNAFGMRLEQANGTEVPIEAHLNYDVLDWRILHDDFRLDPGQGDLSVQWQLPVRSIKVGGAISPDGLANTGMGPFEKRMVTIPQSDYLEIVDLETGGLFFEKDPNSGNVLISIDKSQGVITFNNASSGLPMTGALLLPNATSPIYVPLAGRPLRAIFEANGEWSMQILKPASVYSVVQSLPSQAQCYIGGSNPNIGGLATRLYFPRSDKGNKVSIDHIYYLSTADGQVHQLEGQDFVIHYPPVGDPVGLPMIDLRDVDPNASSFASAYAAPVRGVKGASVSVRILWNPEFFQLGPDATANITKLGQWISGYRKITLQEDLSQ